MLLASKKWRYKVHNDLLFNFMFYVDLISLEDPVLFLSTRACY